MKPFAAANFSAIIIVQGLASGSCQRAHASKELLPAIRLGAWTMVIMTTATIQRSHQMPQVCIHEESTDHPNDTVFSIVNDFMLLFNDIICTVDRVGVCAGNKAEFDAMRHQ